MVKGMDKSDISSHILQMAHSVLLSARGSISWKMTGPLVSSQSLWIKLLPSIVSLLFQSQKNDSFCHTAADFHPCPPIYIFITFNLNVFSPLSTQVKRILLLNQRWYSPLLLVPWHKLFIINWYLTLLQPIKMFNFIQTSVPPAIELLFDLIMLGSRWSLPLHLSYILRILPVQTLGGHRA